MDIVKLNECQQKYLTTDTNIQRSSNSQQPKKNPRRPLTLKPISFDWNGNCFLMREKYHFQNITVFALSLSLAPKNPFKFIHSANLRNIHNNNIRTNILFIQCILKIAIGRIHSSDFHISHQKNDEKKNIENKLIKEKNGFLPQSIYIQIKWAYQHSVLTLLVFTMDWIANQNMWELLSFKSIGIIVNGFSILILIRTWFVWWKHCVHNTRHQTIISIASGLSRCRWRPHKTRPEFTRFWLNERCWGQEIYIS